MRRLEWVRVLALIAVLASSPAWAGRTPHLLAESAEIVPENVVELEQWVWGEGRVPAQPARPVITWVWWAPVLGVSPNLELDFPVQLVNGDDGAALESVGFDARYRIFDRQDTRLLQPLVHLGYGHPLSHYGTPTFDLDAVLVYGHAEALQLTLNVGGLVTAPSLANQTGDAQFFLTTSLGAAMALPHGFRIAAELFNKAPISARAGSSDVLSAGPSIEWVKGPFWITVGALFGLDDHSPRVFPKVLWAVEL